MPKAPSSNHPIWQYESEVRSAKEDGMTNKAIAEYLMTQHGVKASPETVSGMLLAPTTLSKDPEGTEPLSTNGHLKVTEPLVNQDEDLNDGFEDDEYTSTEKSGTKTVLELVHGVSRLRFTTEGKTQEEAAERANALLSDLGIEYDSSPGFTYRRTFRDNWSAGYWTCRTTVFSIERPPHKYGGGW